MSSTNGVAVGDWVKLYQPAAAGGGDRRRRLQAATGASMGRKLRQDERVSVLGVGEPSGAGAAPAPAAAAPGPAPARSARAYALEARPPLEAWYDDPAMQAALEAAVDAQWKLAAEVAANPDKAR